MVCRRMAIFHRATDAALGARYRPERLLSASPGPPARSTSRGRAGLIVATMVALMVGCSGEHTSAGSSTTAPPSSPSTTAPPIGSSLAPGDRYVALGSSIASGFGISVQSTDCGRSNRNYPNLVAARYRLELIDVTCGAAVIPNVVDTPQGTHPPQITALTPDTKLVTVTVGGNDIGYNATALACGNPDTVCTAPAALAQDFAATARRSRRCSTESAPRPRRRPSCSSPIPGRCPTATAPRSAIPTTKPLWCGRLGPSWSRCSSTW